MAKLDDLIIDQYQDLLRYIVVPMLPEGTEVEIRGRARGTEIQLDLLVPEKLRGRVIGRGGRVARSMRNVLGAAQVESVSRVHLDIVD
jgi:hypothetical protein